MKKLMCTLLLAFVSAYSHAALVFGEATIDDDNKVTIDYVFEGTVADTFLFEVVLTILVLIPSHNSLRALLYMTLLISHYHRWFQGQHQLLR